MADSTYSTKNDKFYTPSKKQQKEMLDVVRSGLHNCGYRGAFVVRGALRPTLQLNVPRGQKRRDGGQSYTTYEFTIN